MTNDTDRLVGVTKVNETGAFIACCIERQYWLVVEARFIFI